MNIKKAGGNTINTRQNTKRSKYMRIAQNESPVIKKLKCNQFFLYLLFIGLGLCGISSTVGAEPLGNATISNTSDTIKVENGWANIYTVWYTLSNDTDNSSIERVADRIYYIKKELEVSNSGLLYINSTDVDELRIEDIYDDGWGTVYDVYATSSADGMYIRDVIIMSWNETINNYINNSYQRGDGGGTCESKNPCLKRPSVSSKTSNFWVINTTLLGMGTGIQTTGTRNVQIINNTINESATGVVLTNASGAQLIGNYIRVGYDGIAVSRSGSDPYTDNVTVKDFTFDTTWFNKSVLTGENSEHSNNNALTQPSTDPGEENSVNWTIINMTILNGGRNAFNVRTFNSVYENVTIYWTNHNGINGYTRNVNFTNFTYWDIEQSPFYTTSGTDSAGNNVTPHDINYRDFSITKSRGDCSQLEGYRITATNMNFSNCVGLQLYGHYRGGGYNTSAEVNQTWKNIRFENITGQAVQLYWLGYGDNINTPRIGGELHWINIYMNNVSGAGWYSYARNGLSIGTNQIINTNDDTTHFDADPASVNDTAQLVFYTYISVNVTNSSNSALNGINVSFASNSTIPLLSTPKSLEINSWVIQNKPWTLTGTDGMTPLPSNESWTVAVPYKLVNKTGTYYASWNITVSKFGYQTNSTMVNPDVSWYRSNPNTHQNTASLIIEELTTLALEVTSPTNNTYPTSNITISGRTNKNANITYSLNGAANVSICDNCTTFSNWTNLTIEGQNNVTIYAINSTNSSDNASKTVYFTVDKTEPDITAGPQATSITSSSAVITWTTDEPSNSTVYYGTNTSTTSTEPNSSFVTSHSITLSGLSSGATYYYNVSSCDLAGNCNTSSQYPFTTQSGGGTPSGPGGSGSPTADSDVTENATVIDRKAAVTFSKIAAGKTGTMIIPDTADVPFKELAIKVKNKVLNITIEVYKLTEKPGDIAEDAAGLTHSYIQIDETNIEAADIDTVTITFKVPVSWINDNNVDKATVVLSRYADGTWTALTTTKSSEDSNYVYYSGNSPGLSRFGISGQVQAVTTTTVVTTTTAPPPATTTTVPPSEEPPKKGICGPTAVLLIAMLFPVLAYTRRKSR